MKQTTNIKKKIILWKKIFPPLPEDQKKKFIILVGGSPLPEDADESSEKEPVKPMYPATPLNKIQAEPAAKKDIHHVSNTEGCLVYGAIVTEKVMSNYYLNFTIIYLLVKIFFFILIFADILLRII